MAFDYKKDKIEFRTIALQHIKNVMDLSLTLAVDGKLKVTTMNEAVECLSDVLLPFYDDEMNSSYNEYEEAFKKIEKESYFREGDFMVYRFDFQGLNNITRKLFRALNLLMKRVDYLSSSIYGDGEDSDDEIVEDEEDVE
jgi:hypothetical protein